MAVTLWVRPGHPETQDAVAFLKQQHYGADTTRDLAHQPPSNQELETLRKAFGGSLRSLVDPRNPRLNALLPLGLDAATDADLAALLSGHPELYKAPVLLTPKGAVAGFREQKWRDFLDIGHGR